MHCSVLRESNYVYKTPDIQRYVYRGKGLKSAVTYIKSFGRVKNHKRRVIGFLCQRLDYKKISSGR